MKDGYLTLEEAVREIRGALAAQDYEQISAVSEGNPFHQPIIQRF